MPTAIHRSAEPAADQWRDGDGDRYRPGRQQQHPGHRRSPDFPDAPQVNASNGSVLSGTAEAGVTIVITDGNGNPIGRPAPMPTATGASPR